MTNNQQRVEAGETFRPTTKVCYLINPNFSVPRPNRDQNLYGPFSQSNWKWILSAAALGINSFTNTTNFDWI